MRKSNGLPDGDEVFSNRVKLGSWGFTPSIYFANDGTMYTRTDCGGAYKWLTASQLWQQLLTSDRLPAGYNSAELMWEGTGTYWDGVGCFAFAVAPSDPNYIVMVFAGYMFLSTDGGTSFSRVTSWGRKPGLANTGPERLSNDRVVIDPLDKTVWYAASKTQLFKLTGGGATCTQVATVPDASGTNPVVLVQIDASSAATGGHKSVVHAYSSNNGAYRSTDGGATFSQTKGETLRMPNKLIVDQNGVAHLTSCVASTQSGYRLDRYAAGAWTTPAGLTIDPVNVAVDPTNANRIIVMSSAGYAQMSLDGTATWSSGNIWYDPMWVGKVLGGDIPDIVAEINRRTFLAVSDIKFHPVTGELYVCTGVGIIKCTFPSAYSATAYIKYTIQSAGIEQLVAHHAVSIPGGPMVLLALDRPVFISNDPKVYPTDYYNNAYTLSDGWDADYARDDPNFIAFLANLNGTTTPAISLDKGVTITPMATYPITAIGGSMAVSNKANIVVFPGQNGRPMRTKDMASTWAYPTFPANVPTTGSQGWQFGSLDNLRHIVTADKAQAAGAFYAFNYGTDTLDVTIGGIYESLDGGDSFARVAASPIALAYMNFHTTLRAVPGHSGHLFLATGNVGPINTEQTGADFYRSIDKGRTWTKVLGTLNGAPITTFTEVYFSFGMAAPNAAYPTVFARGYVNGTKMLVRSDDGCINWKRVSEPTIIDDYEVICADLNKYGRVVLGSSGNGFPDGNYRDRLIGSS